MIKTLKERKQEVVEWCQDEYLDKSKIWWKQHSTKYITTKEKVPNINNYIQTSDSFFIKKEYHTQLLGLIIAISIGLFYLKIIFEKLNLFIFICCVLIFLVVIIYLLNELNDKSVKVILTKDCFWFDKMERHIPWNFLATSFIKEEHRGEDMNVYIVLHYYDDSIDDFIKFEYNYGYLKMDIEDICFHIEKFKEKNLLGSI